MWGLFKFILSHSIFLALCAAALSLQTLQLLSLPINGYLLFFIFFAAVVGYNCYWLICRFSFNRSASFVSFLSSCKTAIWVIVVAVAGMVWCMLNLHLVLYNMLFVIFLFGLYTLPVLPFKQLAVFKKTGFLKTVILAFSWAIVTTLIPLQLSIFNISKAAQLVFINHFLLMGMLCIIFDKRDAAVDVIRGLQSLATGMKVIFLHYLMGLVFIGYCITCFFMTWPGINHLQQIALVATGCITIYIYYRSLQKRGYVFYYFLVDGIMFLSAALTVLASI